MVASKSDSKSLAINHFKSWKFSTRFGHAHIYFDVDQRLLADQLRRQVMKELRDQVRVSPMIDHPIGPHPLPMFEVDFFSEDLSMLAAKIDSERNGLSVLFHPVSEDEIGDHVDRSYWLGTKLELNIGFLEDYMARKGRGPKRS